jgi:hypothetical protein
MTRFVSFGSLKPIADKTAAAKLDSLLAGSRPRAGDTDAGGVGTSVTLRQLVGRFTVNFTGVRYFAYPCPPLLPSRSGIAFRCKITRATTWW